MKILQVLTYYRPHISGLTIFAERLSKALVEQGHEVTILTSQTEKHWPLEEMDEGVKIIRVPVAFRISKGVIMPKLGAYANKLVPQHDVVHLHLPQFDAPGFAFRCRLLGKPAILSYHCDLRLPDGLFNRIVDQGIYRMNKIAGSLSSAIVVTTADYGRHSPYLTQYLNKKSHVVPPPIIPPECTDEELIEFRAKHGIDGRPIIGIAARMATEKGVEILLHALPQILEKFPNALVLHAGPYKEVLGEEAYFERLQPLLKKYDHAYKLLGKVSDAELAAFYKSLDCLVVCSLNSTESFGLVQIEAMAHGVPVCACNLPGVRRAVQLTGMGEVVPVGNSPLLAEGVIKILSNKQSYLRDTALIAELFSPAAIATDYVTLYQNLLDRTVDTSFPMPPSFYQLMEMNTAYKQKNKTL